MERINSFFAGLVAQIISLRSREEGQTMVEYGLIVSLISIVAILALTLVGTQVKAVFNTVASVLNATP